MEMGCLEEWSEICYRQRVNAVILFKPLLKINGNCGILKLKYFRKLFAAGKYLYSRNISYYTLFFMKGDNIFGAHESKRQG